jgi:hypothetical protein
MRASVIQTYSISSGSKCSYSLSFFFPCLIFVFEMRQVGHLILRYAYKILLLHPL